MNDEIEKQMEQTIKNDFVNNCRHKWELYKDLLRDCTIYDDDFMDNCNNYKIWTEVMENAKFRRLVLKGREPFDERKTIEIFDIYSMDKLKDLYSRESIRIITQYFIDEISKKHYNNEVIIGKNTPDERVIWNYKEKNADLRLSYLKQKTQKEERQLNTKLTSAQFIHKLLFDEKIDNDAYDFIIQHLQFAKLEDLKKLLKLAEKNFVIRHRGKPSNNKKIYKYDLDDNLIAIYNSRKECMKRDRVSKQALANVLNGLRKTCKGYIYDEK